MQASHYSVKRGFADAIVTGTFVRRQFERSTAPLALASPVDLFQCHFTNDLQGGFVGTFNVSERKGTLLMVSMLDAAGCCVLCISGVLRQKEAALIQALALCFAARLIGYFEDFFVRDCFAVVARGLRV